MASDRVVVGPFHVEDYDSVKALWRACGLDSAPGDELPEIKRKLKRDPELFLVARQGKQVVGAVIGAWDGRRGWIYHLAVASSHRRKGIASMLLQSLERKMRKKGVLKVNAIVYKWNSPSLKMFEKNGFRQQDGQVVVGKYLVGKKPIRKPGS